MRLALYQPDIPQNTGTLIRLGACLGLPVDIIEPTGFPWSDRALKRAGLDYWDIADVTRHTEWETFLATTHADAARRLILLTTKSDVPYTEFAFSAGDTILLGRESAGAPPEVHAAANARLTIPMRPGLRSMNVALSAAMVLGEALRQTKGFADAAPMPLAAGEDE
ncbi:MAG: tRNA (cytidine(34)-2'-O)-methyltransferase [Parvibaculum sp.]|nr:tRNA (cytidine(34)-2'-O)-methyltransferase [Parvibaculum sp.]